MKAIQKAMDQMLGDKQSKINSKLEALSQLRERATAFANSVAGKRGHMTPHPATWFARGSYLDDPTEWDHLNEMELKAVLNQREANVGVWQPA